MNQREPLKTAADQRRSIRYACILDATCEGQTKHLGMGWVARVVNISTGGLAMHMGERFPMGTILTVALHGQEQAQVAARVRVVYCSEQEDGTWGVGAAFLTPLSELELDRLLPPSDVTLPLGR
jgi:hypothetical protein